MFSQASENNQFEEYQQSENGFKNYLHDLADDKFPFGSYRDNQDELLYETLEAMFIEGYRNVVVEGPTGIGKSPVNVAVSRAVSTLNDLQIAVSNHFGVEISGLQTGNSFYTTPQKSLRNQLADDDDLQNYLSMLKSRRDYTCGVTGNNCQDCKIRTDSDKSCMGMGEQCTYWNQKSSTMHSDQAVITFAMLIVDNYLPVETEENDRLSFDDRDLVIVDEGHNGESQSASLFAGFTLSPWTLPEEVYADAGQQVGWQEERYEDVQNVVEEIHIRAQQYVDEYEDTESKQSEVKQCESVGRKIKYLCQTFNQGRGWMVNINEVGVPGSNGKTKSIELKPVRVDDFLADYIWSRGRRRLVTSATIPFRGNIDEWTDRIGLDGPTKFIAKETPFPVEHRKIHLNTIVGKMSSSSEDDNWDDAIEQLEEIANHHVGENGLIHSVSYPRAERIQDSLGSENVMIDKEKLETDAVINKWQQSEKDILVSPTMTEGVDLHGDRCRWQVLIKAPFASIGDNRVSYLLNEQNEWNWYMEETAIDLIQAVGRAVRGPEPNEAASMYVLDEKVIDVLDRINPPQYIVDALTDSAPMHWAIPDAAPWR